MFTGIVRTIGTVERVQSRGGDLRLSILAENVFWQGCEAGESVAVNGVCLTAVAFREDGFDTDVSRETLGVTTLEGLAAGDRVNLEPALSVGDRLGGHLVSGHVDGVGTVTSRHDDARSIRVSIEFPADCRRYIARKGSVCVDGVSLTVNAVSDRSVEVNIIPHTAAATIIGAYEAGTAVNIEVDMLARYLERLLPGSDHG